MSTASKILKTLVPRPLMAVLPVPSEQMTIFLLAAMAYLRISTAPFPLRSSHGSPPEGQPPSRLCRLNVHPVVVLGPAEAGPPLLLPETPPGVVFRPGEEGAVAPPLQLVAVGIVVDGDAPGMHRPVGPAAHPADVEASSP